MQQSKTIGKAINPDDHDHTTFDHQELINLGEIVDWALDGEGLAQKAAPLSALELLKRAQKFHSTLNSARGLGATSEVVLLFNFALEVQQAILGEQAS